MAAAPDPPALHCFLQGVPDRLPEWKAERKKAAIEEMKQLLQLEQKKLQEEELCTGGWGGLHSQGTLSVGWV